MYFKIRNIGEKTNKHIFILGIHCLIAITEYVYMYSIEILIKCKINLIKFFSHKLMLLCLPILMFINNNKIERF